MNPEMQSFLDRRFAHGKEFIVTRGKSLLNELTKTYTGEIWQHMEENALFQIGDKIAVDHRLNLEDVITRQVTFLWSLGYAVGSAGFQAANATTQDEKEGDSK